MKINANMKICENSLCTDQIDFYVDILPALWPYFSSMISYESLASNSIITDKKTL